MRVLVAPDKFAGTMSAPEAADAIVDGWLRARPDDDIERCPMADGGPGTGELVAAAVGATLQQTTVTGPHGRPVDARWWVLPDGRALIESAEACGLHLLAEVDRDPRTTMTDGVGELIREALDAGCRSIVVTLGGSGTNDGGAGALTALGVRFLDASAQELVPGGAALAGLAVVALGGVDSRLQDCVIAVLTDVDSPLCGPDGASAVFGPQKGADAAAVAELDEALGRFAEVLGHPADHGGAAGGLAYGLAVLGAQAGSAADFVAEMLGVRPAIARAGVVLTGEGRLDASTARGKVVAVVARAANDHAVACHALVGEVTGAVDIAGLHEVHALTEVAPSLDEAKGDPQRWLAALAEHVARRLG